MDNLVKAYLKDIIVESVEIEYPNEFEMEPGIEPERYKKYWSSPEIAEEIEKCKTILESLGFKELPSVRQREIRMARPEDVKTVFAGFDGRKNQFAFSRKEIIISEVYKHNGANANTSVQLSTAYVPGGKPSYDKFNGKTYIGIAGAGYLARVKKFKPGISDKLRNKYINEAISVLNSKKVNDISQYAMDPNTNWDEFWEKEWFKHNRED